MGTTEQGKLKKILNLFYKKKPHWTDHLSFEPDFYFDKNIEAQIYGMIAKFKNLRRLRVTLFSNGEN